MNKDEISSTSRAVWDGARAHWRAKHPQASEDELAEIMAGPERAAVMRYLKSLPVSIGERVRATVINNLADEVLDELVAEGKAVTERDADSVLVGPVKGTMAAFQRLVGRRLAKKVRDLDAQYRREGAYDDPAKPRQER